MSASADHIVGLIFGRWRGQILYAGTALGVFDHLTLDRDTAASALAPMIGADPALLYRLLRGLAAIGVLAENDSKAFRLNEAGALLRADHPQSLRAMVLLEEGPEHYAIWKHLVAMVRDGRQNGFLREYGAMGFDHARSDPAYGAIFSQAMSSYSAVQTENILDALAGIDLSSVRTLCDVAGGHGHFACGLLNTYPHLSAIVLDLPEVVTDDSRLWAPKLGLADRCSYLGGDMFREVPPADAYMLKMILHDWNDEESIRILVNLRKSVVGGGHVFIAEHVVPGPAEPHFAKLFDIHMMCWGTGRERTSAEHAELLTASGWRYVHTYHPREGTVSVVAGVAA